MALLANAVPLLAQLDPPPTGIAVTSEPNAPPLPNDPSTRLPIFFPPLPPIMGTVIRGHDVVDLRYVAPGELAPFVNERFYPALSTLYAEKRLKGKLAQRLAAYLASRREAEAKLQACIAHVATLPARERQPALAAFANEQAAALAHLETTAEGLRGDFVAAGTDWNALRSVKIQDHRKTMSAEAHRRLEASALLAAACYVNDLTPLQRDLLIEAVLEALPPDAAIQRLPLITSDRRPLFFLPGAARIVVSRDLPDPLATMVAEFESQKSDLKQELIDTVRRTDLASERSAKKAWQALHSTQAKKLAALERDGEALRVAFLEAREFGWPSLTPRFPPEFEARFRRHRTELRSLHAERDARLEAVRRELLTYRVDTDAKQFRVISNPIWFAGMPGPVGYVHQYAIVGRPGGTPDGEVVLTRIRETVETFQRETAPRLEALNAEERTLAAEAAGIAGAPTGRTPTELFRAFVVLSDQADGWSHYAEYRAAVMQPGLSPAQRRLLFGLALERIAQPLPGGELQPKDGFY